MQTKSERTFSKFCFEGAAFGDFYQCPFWRGAAVTDDSLCSVAASAEETTHAEFIAFLVVNAPSAVFDFLCPFHSCGFHRSEWIWVCDFQVVRAEIYYGDAFDCVA
jgi:hypothetical protein